MNLDLAVKYLDFAIQFTPQYGDSFLEMIKACELLRMQGSSNPTQLKQILEKTKLHCLHSEPNYGILWFYFKDSHLDNAIDIWENACNELCSHQSGKPSYQVNWLASQRLQLILSSGLKIGGQPNECSFDEKLKVIYGFEQLLPVVNHL